VSGTYDRIAGLPLRVEGYRLDLLSLQVMPEFVRMTTVVTLQGGGEEGVGEDVVYDPPDHEAQLAAGPSLPLAGEWTIDGFARHLDGLEMFPAPPVRDFSRNYRRWGFESAALDLALRQAGTSLADALGVAPRPVNFVVSTRLDEGDGAARLRRFLAGAPGLRFKLDPTDEWSPELIDELVALGVVDTLDMKGAYGDDVPFGVPGDPRTYARVAERFPNAWIEDPKLTPALREALRGAEDRVTWDAPIHSVADVRGLPWTPRMINVKPSRVGPLRELMALYDHLRDEGIGAYGGGQTELGPGRGQIQYLASLFHPDGPNDVAPGGYNDPDPPPGLPGPPLPVAASPTGFRWGE
jgi:L-alanine-DL-glutamate epimerase-like enolase superfamily enzyme